jgi:CBS domain-containing protein
MTRRVQTISADVPVYEASALILEHKIGALPVLGDDDQLVGLITETDFVRYAHEMLGGEILD